MTSQPDLKAVLHYRASTGFRRRLREAAPAWLAIEVVPEPEGQDILRALAGADVLLHALTPVTAAMMAAAPKLRFIQKIGVGTNTIDLDAARARGIAVANMPGSNSQAVAEHTLALMLAALRRLVELDRATRAGVGWRLEPDTYDLVGELAGRTVGFIGYGAIPRRLTPALAALGAQVVYFNRSAAPEDAARRLASVEAVLEAADVVSLHLPLTPETQGLINAAALARMKPGAILVNTARGGLVDEPALAAALESGRLAAAGLDVLATEPAESPDASPLLRLSNVIVTPHVAWLTPETLDRSLGVIVENCRRLRAGEPLLHRVV